MDVLVIGVLGRRLLRSGAGARSGMIVVAARPFPFGMLGVPAALAADSPRARPRRGRGRAARAPRLVQDPQIAVV
jgi:hypothetical protein